VSASIALSPRLRPVGCALALETEWGRLQAELAGLSRRGRHVIARGSGHVVHEDRQNWSCANCATWSPGCVRAAPAAAGPDGAARPRGRHMFG
jgi:hypothetical protein